MKKSHARLGVPPMSAARQRGVVLFFALVCLVAIMLAAVALVRSVDTNTIIAGNLALQQSATRSADGGTEAAITWLNTKWAANAARNVLTDPNHEFNRDDATNGYYASMPLYASLNKPDGTSTGAPIQWNDDDSSDPIVDNSGNTTRYVIQRLCRTAGVGVKDAGCLFSGASVDTSSQAILLPQDVCSGPGCPAAGQSVQMRVTSRTVGPRNAVSFVQTFVY